MAVYALNKLTIEVTRRCPNWCVHCSTRSSPFASEEITSQRFEQLVIEGQALGLTQLIISGGEPAVHPQILEMIGFAAARGIQTDLYTSGARFASDNSRTHLTDRFCAQLRDAGLSSAIVSLHSHEADVHDRIMQCSGSFDRATRSIKSLTHVSIPVEIHAVAMRVNVDSLPGTARLAESLGAEALRILRLVRQGRASADRVQDPSSAQYERLAGRLKELATDLPGFEIELGAHFNFLSHDTRPCTAGADKGLVGPDGVFCPCPALKDWSAQAAMPSVHSVSLASIWRGEALADWRKAMESGADSDCCPAQRMLREIKRSTARMS